MEYAVIFIVILFIYAIIKANLEQKSKIEKERKKINDLHHNAHQYFKNPFPKADMNTWWEYEKVLKEEIKNLDMAISNSFQTIRNHKENIKELKANFTGHKNFDNQKQQQINSLTNEIYRIEKKIPDYTEHKEALEAFIKKENLGPKRFHK